MLIKSRYNSILFCLQILTISIYCYADTNVKNEGADTKDVNITFFDEVNNQQYTQYMLDVFKEIDNDEGFQKRLSSLNNSTSYKDFMEAFKFTSESARNKLDEIKRREIDRLNRAELQLRKAIKKHSSFDREVKNGIIHSMTAKDKNHLHTNQNAEFTVKDLEKLITKIRHDLKMTDLAKEQQYKKHEMRKRLRQKKSWEKTKDPNKKKVFEDDWKAVKEKYSDHEKINEPGNEEQIKEIWKNVDHLDSDYFNPKTFFNLHDLNQDDQWDLEEIEAMILPGIKKAYSTENENVDSEEVFHEIMKMRQHFMKKMDRNGDQIVTLEEFQDYSLSKDYKRNDDWKVTEEIDNPVYSDEEMKIFERELESLKDSNYNFTPSLNVTFPEEVKAPKNVI